MDEEEEGRAVPSLLDLAIWNCALALGRDNGSSLPVQAIPEPELAFRIWHAYERQRTTVELTPRDKQLLVRFAAFWPVRRLQLPHALPGRLSKLQVVGNLAGTLEHLEVAVSSCTDDLKWMQGLAKLKCLSLRNSPSLQPDSLFALIQLPALQSLDLHALLHLTDDIGPIIAQLPSLRALNMGMTSVGNNFVRCLTRRLELDAWARSTGSELDASQLAWPRLIHLEHLGLQQTRCDTSVLPALEHLSSLVYLDMRRTRVSRHDLIGLERKLRLVALHGGPVLATSNAAALPYYHQNGFACCCGVPHGKPQSDLEAWGQESIRKLVY